MRQVCFPQRDWLLPRVRQRTVWGALSQMLYEGLLNQTSNVFTYMIWSIQGVDIFKFSFQVDVLVSPKSTHL